MGEIVEIGRRGGVGMSWQAMPRKAPGKLGDPGRLASSDRIEASKFSARRWQAPSPSRQAKYSRAPPTSTRSPMGWPTGRAIGAVKASLSGSGIIVMMRI